MKRIYDQIKEIDSKDKCSIPEAVCKFSEESGEMIREINKTFGRKITTESKEEVILNIKEEMADTIQNIFLIASRFGISLEDLESEMERKNQVWSDIVNKK